MKKLCILGTASTVAEAPYEDDSFEMWGVSGLASHDKVKRLDKVFELHPVDELRTLFRHYEGVKNFKGEVVMIDHYDEIPNSVAYPYDEVKEKFWHPMMGDKLFATNSVTWMLLLALHLGYTDISLFGVHMSHESEYAYQRSSCSWVLGIIHGWILEGKPYHIHIVEESELMRARYEYGFQQPTELMAKIKYRMESLRKGVDKTRADMDRLKASVIRTEGAAEEAKFWLEYVAGHK